MVISGPGLRAYGSWKEFAATVAKAVIREQARLIREEGKTLAGADDSKVTAPPVRHA